MARTKRNLGGVALTDVAQMPPLKQPRTPVELQSAIRNRYESLPPVMQEIGKFVLDSPNTVALETAGNHCQTVWRTTFCRGSLR